MICHAKPISWFTPCAIAIKIDWRKHSSTWLPNAPTHYLGQRLQYPIGKAPAVTLCYLMPLFNKFCIHFAEQRPHCRGGSSMKHICIYSIKMWCCWRNDCGF